MKSMDESRMVKRLKRYYVADSGGLPITMSGDWYYDSYESAEEGLVSEFADEVRQGKELRHLMIVSDTDCYLYDEDYVFVGMQSSRVREDTMKYDPCVRVDMDEEGNWVVLRNNTIIDYGKSVEDAVRIAIEYMAA